MADTQQTPTAQRSYKQTRVRRRVPFLENLSSEARKAFEQELLDQACMFRQIAAARNGVPGVVERNYVEESVTDQQDSTETQTMTSAQTTAVPAAAATTASGLVKKVLPWIAAAAIGSGGTWGYWLSQQPKAAADAAGQVTAATIDNDAALTQWLKTQNISGAEQTDLGAAMRQAMTIDPSLRTKFLQMTKETLSTAPK